MDIGDWLRGLGLERYEQAFRDAAIDADILPDLTGEHLKELGIPLGHRIQLTKAIAALAEQAPVQTTPSPKPAAPTDQAERRQLTVLFCDLVGSTALSSQLDPEDMRDAIRAYQNACAGVIARLEGFVAKFMGDGVLAYFGYPRAHEDEAERAVRSGLALVEAIAELRVPRSAMGGDLPEDSLAVRVGIATGLVVVGDLVGDHASEERMVVGDTPNLAARLQAMAQPGQVVIAEATRRLIGAGFELADLGPQTLKGLAEPVLTFAVTGERAIESRFEAQRQVLPMVGRDQELALLLERWAQARAGEGQGVLLVGEAGIGKSRITRALLDALADEPHTRVRYQCSPYHRDSALWPVIQWLSHAAGLEPNDPVETSLDRLEALLDRAGGRDDAPLIADLLGLDGAERYGDLALTSQALRNRTLEALAQQLRGLAARQPVLMLLEDAHWIDPTTLELIELCLDWVAPARVLLIMTSRPDNQPMLLSHPHVMRLTINRLERAGIEAIVARLGGDQLASATIDAIIERADAVPLFVEELTKAVLDSDDASIPASLHDSLMARLDRIPEAKEAARIAACLGREFDFSLLVRVAERPEGELIAALNELVDAEIILPRDSTSHISYSFKHALVRDAAYHSLLNSERQVLHATIADAIERHFPERAAVEPAILAQHYAGAALWEPAISYWETAAEEAIERSAYAEAIGHLSNALKLLGAQPTTVECARRELALRIRLGPPLMVIKGYASAEVRSSYDRARQLCHEVGDQQQLYLVLRGLKNTDLLSARHNSAHDLAKQMAVLAEREQSSVYLLDAHNALGETSFYLGEFGSARAMFDQAISLYDSERCGVGALQSNTDLGVVSCAWMGWTLWFLGYPDQARSKCYDALALARRSGHPHTVAHALGSLGPIHQLCRETKQASEIAEELLALAEEQGIAYFRVVAMIVLGWALASRDRGVAGIAALRDGLAAGRAIGTTTERPWHLTLLADVQLEAGFITDGLATVAEALALTRCTSERAYEAETLRVHGELLLRQGGSEAVAAAENHLCDALSIARAQNARSLELRVGISLARLWIERDQRRRAQDLLTPIYGWFTEGFNSEDLREAKALLEQLRALA